MSMNMIIILFLEIIMKSLSVASWMDAMEPLGELWWLSWIICQFISITSSQIPDHFCTRKICPYRFLLLNYLKCALKKYSKKSWLSFKKVYKIFSRRENLQKHELAVFKRQDQWKISKRSFDIFRLSCKISERS